MGREDLERSGRARVLLWGRIRNAGNKPPAAQMTQWRPGRARQSAG